MFPFEKFESLTARIDRLIIAAVRRRSPWKYWSFCIADKLAKLGTGGAFVMIVAYLLIGAASSRARGGQVDPEIVKTFGNIIFGLVGIGVLGTIVRMGLHQELEASVLEMWSKGIAKDPDH